MNHTGFFRVDHDVSSLKIRTPPYSNSAQQIESMMRADERLPTPDELVSIVWSAILDEGASTIYGPYFTPLFRIPLVGKYDASRSYKQSFGRNVAHIQTQVLTEKSREFLRKLKQERQWNINDAIGSNPNPAFISAHIVPEHKELFLNYNVDANATAYALRIIR